MRYFGAELVAIEKSLWFVEFFSLPLSLSEKKKRGGEKKKGKADGMKFTIMSSDDTDYF